MSDSALLSILTKAADYLKSKGVPNARLDAELLLAHVLKVKRLDLYLQFDRPLTESELEAYRVVMRRRGTREPLQHIEGTVAFRELTLLSDKRALVPRPETELLVDAVKKHLPVVENPPLLDIGTGTGRIAELLADRANHVTGLDKSPEMLRLARTRLQDLPADRLDLVQGDFTALPFASESFDTVIFHQVLHYAQEPAPALAEAARVCRPGGTIAIVDFAAHDREELRTQHAHARLGFSDEQMLGLLADAGFRAAPPVALPGKPLTVKIWTGQRLADQAHAPRAPHRKEVR